MDVRVISIGVLSAHPLRGEKSPMRTGHATTSLVRAGDRVILVDPGLPAEFLEARLGERAGIKPAEVTDVFLTRFHPECRRGITLFDKARWLVGEAEREAVGVPLAGAARRALDENDLETAELLGRDIAILQRCEAAPDLLAPGVSLFPMPGVSPGLCGLLLSEPKHTTLIAGDAVVTQEHLEQGKVLAESTDLDQARESFTEAIEVADLIIAGRDNLLVNPTKRPF